MRTSCEGIGMGGKYLGLEFGTNCARREAKLGNDRAVIALILIYQFVSKYLRD